MAVIMSMRSRSMLCAVVVASAVCSIAQAEDLTGRAGAQLYKEFCASCHGEQGRGDGPVASSLKVEVPDLTRLAIRHGGNFPTERVRAIIDGRTTLPPHGTRAMPVWGLAFGAAVGNDPGNEYRTQGFIALLVDYVRSIQHRASDPNAPPAKGP
jgi:mono/diheme cytochrome c family protein